MRVIIASDDRSMASRIRVVLRQRSLDCPEGHLVSLDSAADRAGVICPDLGILVMPADTTRGLDVLGETHNTMPRMRTLVFGPASDAKLILETLKRGAHEYLDQESVEDELSGALTRCRAAGPRPEEQGKAGKVITLISPSGGSGSSTLSASIATALAQAHGECGLIDLRFGVGDLAPMLGVRPNRSLGDMCDSLARLDQRLFEQFLTRHSSGVRLLAAPVQAEAVERVTNKGVRRALALSRVRFPYVVVDMDGSLSERQTETLWQTDEILLVVRLDYTSVRNARRIIDSMIDMGIGRDRMRLLVNGFRQRCQLEREQVEAALGMKIRHQIPYDPAAVNLAINDGMPVVLRRRYSRISRCIRGVAKSVNGAVR
jgi:pilus assembly protein CpaE